MPADLRPASTSAYPPGAAASTDGKPGPARSLRLDVVRDPPAFAALRAEWNELIDDSDAAIFNSWEWLYPWYRLLGGEREPAIYIARDEHGRLAGLLPLAIEKKRIAGLPIRRLAFMGETHVGSDYLDVVARRDRKAEVIDAFARRLAAGSSSWDVLDLLDMDEDSAALPVFRAALAASGFTVRVADGSICPYEIFTPGQDFDGFLRGTSRRDNYLRRRKWLEKQPGYRVERATHPRDVATALEDFFRVHALRWAAAGGSGGITGPRTEAFHRHAAGLLAERGHIRLYTMKLGEETLASVYGMLERDKFIYYQSGYDPEWAAKSVGMVLVGETFKDAVEAGLREYDFLRGSETYKSEWTTRTRRTLALRAFRARGRGAWLGRQERAGGALRRLARQLLPESQADMLRRLLRRREAA